MKNYAKIAFCRPITVILFTVFFAVSVNAQAGNGWLSRYWDGCKPSCSWSGKPTNGQGQCKECDKSDNKMSTNDGNRNSCDGGNAYTCWDMAPWSVSSTLAYGFAAGHNDGQCGTCWELTFNGQTNGSTENANFVNGKKLVVMISNIGGDVQGNQLDFLVPGGGVGAFDAFSNQIGVQKSALGAQYGGLVSDGCQGKPSCLKTKCDNVFSGTGRKEWLKAGCYFYADWMGAVDNPRYNAVKVECPAALTDRWKNAATGSPGGGSNPTPTPTTYTLTVNKNPATGGTTNPASSQSNITAGTQVDISATANSGYTFNNWTIASGSGTIASANSTSTKITVNGNVTVTANFTQNAQTYSLTVERNPTAGGTTNISTQTGITAGTQVSITATAATGYTFSNWTITSGSGNIASANSASTSITVNGNVTVRANFTQNPTTYTLTVAKNPTAGGSVTANNSSSTSVTVNGGTSVPISATPASDYTFTNWTVTSGTAQINNVNSASTTVSLSANATITANFTKKPDEIKQYTLTVSRLPDDNAGTVKVSNANYTDPVKVNGGTAVNIEATPAPNYKFTNWTVSYGNASINNASIAATAVTLNADALIVANFTSTAVQPPPSTGSGDTIKVEAEDYDSKNGNNIQTGTIDGGGMCIGYIESGNSTTYNINVPKSDDYTLQFRVATGEGNSSFTVSANGQNIGTVSTNNTGGWNDYVIVTLSSKAKLNAGSNTIVLNFQNAVNVDYFLVIGTTKSTSSSSQANLSSSSAGNTPIRLSQIANNNHVVQTVNGMNMAVKSSAVVSIYRLNGNLVQRQNFDSGIYSVSLGHLPRGMYIVKVKFGSETKLLRIPVI